MEEKKGNGSLFSPCPHLSEVQEGEEGPSSVTLRCLGFGTLQPDSDFPQFLFPLCPPPPN